MKIKDFIGNVIGIADKEGWMVTAEYRKCNPIVQWRFSIFTSAGQDLNIEVEMDKRDVSTLVTNLENHYESFEPEAETMLWLDQDGHGKNGAPYHMKDVLADMEEAEKKICELYKAVEKYYLLVKDKIQ